MRQDGRSIDRDRNDRAVDGSDVLSLEALGHRRDRQTLLVPDVVDVRLRRLAVLAGRRQRTDAVSLEKLPQLIGQAVHAGAPARSTGYPRTLRRPTAVPPCGA